LKVLRVIDVHSSVHTNATKTSNPIDDILRPTGRWTKLPPMSLVQGDSESQLVSLCDHLVKNHVRSRILIEKGGAVVKKDTNESTNFQYFTKAEMALKIDI
jgi:hypothetical protein